MSAIENAGTPVNVILKVLQYVPLRDSEYAAYTAGNACCK